MSGRPYFTISRESFEKNAGYKTTVHALAELVDNAFEAEAKKVAIILMVDHNQVLRKIATIDNGDGMNPKILQSAVCEKAGTNFDRQVSSGKKARRKFGKYGVGLPKASLSQCNRFTVWSWLNGTDSAHESGVDINNEEWIKKGAVIEDPQKNKIPDSWIDIAKFINEKSGTMILWEDLDGLTWSRARWGEHSGLIPNLENQIGRTYRKMLSGQKPEFEIEVIVTDERFREKERLSIGPNDPLFITPGCNVPKEKLGDGTKWPPDEPMYDVFREDEIELSIPMKNGDVEKKTITYKSSMARKDVFAKLNNRDAGGLPHGKLAAKNLGISFLREGREIDLSLLLNNPSEPRERWVGVEFNFPHELDDILGMTNNKQNYTRLEQVLKHPKKDYIEDDETFAACLERIRREDPVQANCLEVAWKIQDVWKEALKSHLQMRIDERRKGNELIEEAEDEDTTPEGQAEQVATTVDNPEKKLTKEISDIEKEQQEHDIIVELKNRGIGEGQAKQIAARIIERGLSYAIANRSNLGSPFFSVLPVADAKVLVLNQDHPIHPYITSSLGDIENESAERLRKRLEKSKVCIMLMLEAWTKIESEAPDLEKRKYQRLREDWGRVLEGFIEEYEKSER